jgi:NAD(P)-dependent dehydrogenase (short-subunit alcohol dehydrogenase family)
MSDGRLAGRVAIVTGGGRGIGRAYAERFLREGASVVLADVSDEEAAATADKLSSIGPVVALHCDVSSPDSTEECARQTVEQFGRLDVLVNNAALYGDWDMSDHSYDYLKRVFDVNLHGVWLMTRAVAPIMASQGYGRIVNQSSAAAYLYRDNFPRDDFAGLSSYSYQQTKYGVIGLTKFTAGQLGRYGITVNCIAPGVVATAATLSVVPRETVEQIAAMQAVQGVVHAEDLTGAAVFFASEEARFVSGQVLVVDGGRNMPA